MLLLFLIEENIFFSDIKLSVRLWKIENAYTQNHFNYEGDSICNEIVQINKKVLYLYALQLHSQKDLLLGYTTTKSQLSSSFPTLHNPLSRKGTKLHCDTN